MKYYLPPDIVAIDKQRKRKKWILISSVLLGIVILFIGFIVAITWVLKSSDAYKVAETVVYEDEKVIGLTGGVEGINMSSGNISINNGYGTASFTMDVEGQDHDVEVYIEMKMEPLGNWQVTKLITE